MYVWISKIKSYSLMISKLSIDQWFWIPSIKWIIMINQTYWIISNIYHRLLVDVTFEIPSLESNWSNFIDMYIVPVVNTEYNQFNHYWHSNMFVFWKTAFKITIGIINGHMTRNKWGLVDRKSACRVKLTIQTKFNLNI